MTNSEFAYLLLLFPAGAVAGTINVIAGGGSFLSLPVLMAAGLPVDIANGTNRISVVVQGVFATVDFKKKGAFDGPLYRKFLPWLLGGALIGAYGATRIDPQRLKSIFGVVFVLMGSYMLLKTFPRKNRVQQTKEDDPWFAGLPLGVRYAALLLVGIYGGFIQAGVGLWILLTGSSLLRLDTIKVNAIKLPLTLTFTVPALILFLQAGMVRWLPGLILAAGTLVGAKIGVSLSIQGGQKLILRAVTGVLLVTGTHLLLANN